jgi:hypothetical protein
MTNRVHPELMTLTLSDKNKMEKENKISFNKLSKGFFSVIFLLCLAFSLKAQDIIRLQYNDSICARVLAVNKKKIDYQMQTFFDSMAYTVKRKKVVEIEYADGVIRHISKDRWNKLYQPAVYLIFGEYFGEITLNDYSIIASGGIGHKGIFRLPVNGFGILYNADFRYGQYEYHADAFSGEQSRDNMYTVSLATGIEYRYSFYSPWSAFADFSIGKSRSEFYDKNVTLTVDNFVYSFSSGMYLYRFQMGLKLSWGTVESRSIFGAPLLDFPIPDGAYKMRIFDIFFAYYF